MSASWLITDGFSGEAAGVNKIVTMGLYSGAAPAVSSSSVNWLSPTPLLSVILFFLLIKWL